MSDTEASHIWPAWLQDAHSGIWLRLRYLLEHDDGFTLIIMICDDSAYQQRIIQHLQQSFGHQHIIDVAQHAEDTDFMAELYDPQYAHATLHLIGTQHWLRDKQHIKPAHRINYQRERIAATLQHPLLLWLNDAQVTAFAREAPDAWAWRSALLDFTGANPQVDMIHHESIAFTSAQDVKKRQERLQEIDSYLSNKKQHSTADISLLLEQANLLRGLGELETSLHTAKTALSLSQRLDDKRHEAMAHDQIANILQARGKLDKALRIYQEQTLPVYEQLGDVRSRAITMSKIADILQARGKLDEALRIYQEETLPVYEQLGDVRSRAITMGKIADILQARGKLDEALRIHQEEELPVYEQLSDVRSRAVTMGKIADILQVRGKLDEALRIRQEEELLVYEQLGDVRSRAMTMGKIADILQARGKLDEALRIYQEETLPVYEQLSDVRSRAVTMGKIADILQARGKLDEALRIYQEETLPVYEQLGDVRSLMYGRTYLAQLMQKIDATTHQQAVQILFTWSLVAAMNMKLPEVEQITGLMQQAKIPLPNEETVQSMLADFSLALDKT